MVWNKDDYQEVNIFKCQEGQVEEALIKEEKQY
jgi:hypothetical protein